MKVIASKQGYFGKLREPGEVFDVPAGTKASWFAPAEPVAKPKASKPAPPEADKGDDLV